MARQRSKTVSGPDFSALNPDIFTSGLSDFTAPRSTSTSVFNAGGSANVSSGVALDNSPAPGSVPRLSVTDFLAICNQTLDFAFPSALVEGEVSSFKVNQGKWIFFDLKDEQSSLGCFLPLAQLRFPLADGMKILARGHPKVTAWGKFSFTVQQILPVGTGTIKQSFELLKRKLDGEGLFDPARKRPLPENLRDVGVISSTQAAGYADFVKILNERWGGLRLQVAHTAVQGLSAADQIIRALQFFNEQSEVQVIAILRGGGSADDLAVFNDEKLVRAIAASKIPVLTGIGHEVDESLADLAADLRASTPSNAAQMLTPDRHAELAHLHSTLDRLESHILQKIDSIITEIQNLATSAQRQIMVKIDTELEKLQTTRQVLAKLDPELILSQGYAILKGNLEVGDVVKITTLKYQISAKIEQIHPRK